MPIDRNIFFSIVCPTYNSEIFIEKNILSILSQTYQNYEIIYSDDGSSDKTLQILEKYKNSFLQKGINIQIIENPHFGPGAARNKGIKKSNYEWISFIDSDDVWDPKKLEKVAKIINNSSEYNCIVHNEFFKEISGKIKKLNYKEKFTPNKLVYNQLFIKNFLSTSTISLKKDLIKNANYFDENLLNAQDYDLWLKIGNNFNFYFIDEYLGYYNERVGNITSRPYKKKVINLLNILKKNKKKVSKILLFYKLCRILLNKEWFK